MSRGQPPRQIREQVPAAFVEAAEEFRTRAAAAALIHDIVLRSCDEDAGKGRGPGLLLQTPAIPLHAWNGGEAGLPLSQIKAALDAWADALLPLYAAVPRTGRPSGALFVSLLQLCPTRRCCQFFSGHRCRHPSRSTKCSNHLGASAWPWPRHLNSGGLCML